MAGFVFVSLISNAVDREPGMTDCVHVGELILGLQLTGDLNDLMSASAAHLTVTFTWMNARTELKLPADPVLWLNSALCDGNGKTSVPKYRVMEQLDCGRVGWIQDAAMAGLQDEESLVIRSIPMAFEVALVTTSWLPHMETSMVAPMASMVAPMASMVAPMASMASMITPMALMVASMATLASMGEMLMWWKQMMAESQNGASLASMAMLMAMMKDSMASSLSKEETTSKGVREGPKSKHQNRRRYHEAAMTLLVTLLASTMASMVASMASMASMATMASMVVVASVTAMVMMTSVAAMVALLVSSRSKEETTANGDRESHKESRENGGRCHESKVALMMTSMASMALVASMASMASLASMALRSLMASMASMASLASMAPRALVVDERAGWLNPRCEEILIGALELVSKVSQWMVPLAPLVSSMASKKICGERADAWPHKKGDEGADGLTHKSDGERVDRLTYKICEERADGLTHKIREERVDWASHKSCEERADGLTHKSCEERADGLTHKICEEQADGLTNSDGERARRWAHKIREERADSLTKSCEKRADGLTYKICEEQAEGLTKSDDERAERWTHKIRGERADGLTHKNGEERVVGLILKIIGVRVQRFTHNNNNNNNISEERADGLTLWLVDGDGSWCALDCVRCGKTWRSSFVEIGNKVHVRDDGLGEVEWPCRWHQWCRVGRCWWFWWLQWLRWRRRYCGWTGGVDGVDGVDWWRRWLRWVASTMVTGVPDTEGTDVEVPLCPQ